MTQFEAVTMWNEMSPMKRYEIMQKVGYMKSVTKRYRACIALLQREE